MSSKIIDPVCPMFGDACRHCSEEISRTGLFTRLKKNPVSGLFDPDGIKTRKVELGAFCNNNGRTFVKDLHYCPARWGLRRWPTNSLVKRGKNHGIRHPLREAHKKPVTGSRNTRPDKTRRPLQRLRR